MPDEATYKALENIGNEISSFLNYADGYIFLGRQTADNVRNIYFVCREFRKPSLVMHNMVERYTGKFDMGFDIYKDKYWRSFKRFMK